MSPLVLERQEHELALRVRAFLAGSGHSDCGEWRRDSLTGQVSCGCGAVLLVTHAGTGWGS